jgi:hypothetical protein
VSYDLYCFAGGFSPAAGGRGDRLIKVDNSALFRSMMRETGKSETPPSAELLRMDYL